MTTEAQVCANRANAQKYTGPQTAEGKATVAQNAVTHGLLARAAAETTPSRLRRRFWLLLCVLRVSAVRIRAKQTNFRPED